MDKSWIMERNRISQRYKIGVKEFLDFAAYHMKGSSVIRCPCILCRNLKFGDLDMVKAHIHLHGFDQTYLIWINHGEEVVDLFENEDVRIDIENDNVINERERDDPEFVDMLNNLLDLERVMQESRQIDMDNGNNNATSEMFKLLFEEANQDLYSGANKVKTFSFLVNLMQIKVLNCWSNRSFDMLLKFLQSCLPQPNYVPESYYAAKKILQNVWIGYQIIHACENGCKLFRKECANLEKCPICEKSRYILNNKENSKIPTTVVRHFPLKPRLQRFYLHKDTAIGMRWHKDKRVESEGILRYPADAIAWKEFDKMYPTFASESRNVRFGLASDGFNPFGMMSNSYSMWPVILVPYNMAPWHMMKQAYTLMTLLIPGPRSPGKNIDVFLEPLIEELKELWHDGIMTLDSSTGEYFNLRAIVLWTIHDFPAYGMISGWSTKGYKACPICNVDTDAEPCINKLCYMGHRRKLSLNHIWRRSKKFNGRVENRPPPRAFTSDDILIQMQTLCRKRKHGDKGDDRHNWMRKSIFYELEYWPHLKLRHNLDVMHIEKNVCDAIVGTLLDTIGKSKDTPKARMDLEKKGLRPELHLQKLGNKTFKPIAKYNLKPDDRKDFCKWLKSVRFPDGYAANISRRVIENEGRLQGLKTHDCHILFQNLLPIGIRKYLQKDVCEAIIELCSFFHEITKKTLIVDKLKKLQREIVIILCKLELIFPPAFFDIMIHLSIHLPEEAMLAGPVSSRWMYPFERYLGTLKKYVRNKAKPEGSIAEGYVIDEALTFMSLFKLDGETRFSRPERNVDGERPRCELDVFSQNVNLIGRKKYIKFDQTTREKAHWYILSNCSAVQPYIKEHLESIIEMDDIARGQLCQEKEFPSWFRTKMAGLRKEAGSQLINELYSLSCMPNFRVCTTDAAIVEGIRYHSQERDRGRITQNYGVAVPSSHNEENMDFFGVLLEVFELSYMFGYNAYLFNCKWYECTTKKKSLKIDFGLTCINTSKTWYKDDPFILASQAKQVFYIDDHKFGGNWKIVQTFQHRHIWDYPEVLDNDDTEHQLQLENSSLIVHDTIVDSVNQQPDRIELNSIEIPIMELQVNENESRHSYNVVDDDPFDANLDRLAENYSDIEIMSDYDTD